MVRLAVRGFIYPRKTPLFEDRLSLPIEELEHLLPSLAEKHATAMLAHEMHMIEIEFLDEPKPEERFFRFGTDPRGMLLPVRLL